MDIRLLWVLCVVRQKSLRRADHSSRGVLPTVMRRYVWSRNFVNEEVMAHWGLSRQKQRNKPSIVRILEKWWLLLYGLWTRNASRKFLSNSFEKKNLLWFYIHVTVYRNPNLFCYKTLHVSGNLFAHHQEFSTVYSAQLSFVQVFDDRFQAQSGWYFMSSILTLFGNGHRKPAWNLPVPNVQQRTPDDGHRGCPKHVEFYNRIKFG